MILHYRDNFDKFVQQTRFFNFFVNFQCFTPDESFDDVITLIMTSSNFFFVKRFLDTWSVFVPSLVDIAYRVRDLY